MMKKEEISPFVTHVYNSFQSLYFHLKGVSKNKSGMFSKSSATDLLYLGKGFYQEQTLQVRNLIGINLTLFLI